MDPRHRTTRHRTARRCTVLAVILLAALSPAGPARAVTPNRAIAAAVLTEPRTARTGLRLEAAAWLEGGLEATASLGWWSAGRSMDRGAAGSAGSMPAGGLAPGLGLRWALERPGWRPEVAAEVGCRWARGGARAVAAAAAVRGGVEWLPSRTVGLGLSVGLRWPGAGPAALELAAVVRRYL